MYIVWQFCFYFVSFLIEAVGEKYTCKSDVPGHTVKVFEAKVYIFGARGGLFWICGAK